MAKPIKEWDKEIQPFMDWANKDENISTMWNEKFMRDPSRARYMSQKYFVSPADGIILYQDTYKPDEKLLEVKGVHYTVRDMMDDQTFDKECLVIGIFMTYYDVHINRVPYSGALKYKLISPTTSYNRPMVFAETDIDLGKIAEIYNQMHYLKTNMRMLNTFYNPNLDYTYYVTQIADQDVNVITHFSTKQNAWFDQGDRFSFVRWGSQVELIMPIDPRFEFKTLVPDLWHVEGTTDRLVEIIKK